MYERIFKCFWLAKVSGFLLVDQFTVQTIAFFTLYLLLYLRYFKNHLMLLYTFNVYESINSVFSKKKTTNEIWCEWKSDSYNALPKDLPNTNLVKTKLLEICAGCQERENLKFRGQRFHQKNLNIIEWCKIVHC